MFRAYTKQLRGEYVKARKGEQAKQAPARGFERVEISEEAKALAAAGGHPVQRFEEVAPKEQRRQAEDSKNDSREEQTEDEQTENADTSTGIRSGKKQAH
ncbi:MAG: hypothetical protein GY854_24490 [Deltaproteobacteria bacterium]|nr:hypothetical protein [Deltaproteobacteria bacterium]